MELVLATMELVLAPSVAAPHQDLRHLVAGDATGLHWALGNNAVKLLAQELDLDPSLHVIVGCPELQTHLLGLFRRLLPGPLHRRNYRVCEPVPLLLHRHTLLPPLLLDDANRRVSQHRILGHPNQHAPAPALPLGRQGFRFFAPKGGTGRRRTRPSGDALDCFPVCSRGAGLGPLPRFLIPHHSYPPRLQANPPGMVHAHHRPHPARNDAIKRS
mmetsp:Transcript_16629/g.40284  ORF Transcript_16629/g.40284 Transcript_16629/m.40284 type:complete len:215 (+) Transcript_16629:498-1142(+)